MLSWLLLGTHVYVLCAALGHAGLSAFALCVGGTALAISAGVLLIPVPAGAGLREVVLLLVLRSIMTNGQALVVVLGSRALLIMADLLLATLAAGPGAVRAMFSRERRSAL